MSKAGDRLFGNKLRWYLVCWNKHWCLAHRPSPFGRRDGRNVHGAGDAWLTPLRSEVRRPRLELG